MQPRAFAGQGKMDSSATDKPLARLEVCLFDRARRQASNQLA